MSREIIPRPHDKFMNFEGNLLQVSFDYRDELGIPQEAFIAIGPSQDKCESAYAKWRNPAIRNHVKVVGFRCARADFEPKLRQFKNKWLVHNEKATDMILAKAGLKRRKKKSHEQKIFLGQPNVTLVGGPGNAVHVYFGMAFNENEATGHFKPQGSRAEIRYVIGGDEPQSHLDCPICESTGKNHYNIVTGIGDSGKKIYVFVRFATNNKTGPWSVIKFIFIP